MRYNILTTVSRHSSKNFKKNMTGAKQKSRKMPSRESNEMSQKHQTEGTPPVISVRGLSKTYGSGANSVTALSDADFDIQQGSVVGILGPNGAGKTTLIKSLLNLVLPSSGSIELFGTTVDTHDVEIYRRIGAMFEGARNIYWRLSVRQNLNFFTRLDGEDPASRSDRFDSLLRGLDLKDKEHEKVRNLSRGQKQKVALATILSGENDLIFLDEPTLGLDVESSQELQRELSQLVDDGETTVVLSSHDMDVIENLCDRVIIVQDGEIIADDTIDSLYGVFETDLYEITVESEVSNVTKQKLKSRYELQEIERDEGVGVHYRFTVTDANEVPSIANAFVDSGADLVKVGLVERDFEDVFLSVTDSDSEPMETKSVSNAPSHTESLEVDRA